MGHNIVKELLEQGETEIYGLAFPNDPGVQGYQDNPCIHIVEGSLTDEESLRRFMAEADEDSYLIHAAGKVSVYRYADKATMEVNLQGTKNIVEEALRHPFRRFVYVSSVDALPQSKGGVVIDPSSFDPKRCLGVYGKSKALAGQYVLNACKEKGLPAVVVCPSALLGPNDPFCAPLNDALLRFCKGKIPALTPGGYDIADSRDVAKAIVNALHQGNVGECYLLTGTRLSVKELFGHFATVAQKKTPRLIVSFFPLYIAAPFSELLARIQKKRPLLSVLALHCLRLNPTYDSSKAKKDLGFSPREIDQTIADTIAYFQKTGRLS